MRLPRRSRAFSVQSFQSYLLFFWSSPMVSDEMFIEDEDDDDVDEEEFEPGQDYSITYLDARLY